MAAASRTTSPKRTDRSFGRRSPALLASRAGDLAGFRVSQCATAMAGCCKPSASMTNLLENAARRWRRRQPPRHHRAQAVRSAADLSGSSTTRSPTSPTGRCSVIASSTRSAADATTAGRSPSCSWTSTTSRRSTTPSATPAGDRSAADRSRRACSSALRVGDTVARLGGDEFAILLEDVADETAVSEIVEELLEAISAPLTLDDREVSVQCSIGIAVARSGERHRSSHDGRRTAAQRRRRDVPGEGRRRQHLPPLQARDARGRRRAARAARRSQGRDRGEGADARLPADLRPGTGEIVGYEALLRWEHAVRGTVLAGHVHPCCRGLRADHPARPLGSRACVR